MAVPFANVRFGTFWLIVPSLCFQSQMASPRQNFQNRTSQVAQRSLWDHHKIAYRRCGGPNPESRVRFYIQKEMTQAMPKATTAVHHGQLLSIQEALDLRQQKHQLTVYCRECGEQVRAHKTGTTGQAAHFEHLRRNLGCSLSSKP
jgi:hypothetical protein